MSQQLKSGIPGAADDLQTLPNVGLHLSAMLHKAGIHTSGQLIETGTEEAFLKIREFDPGACLSMLSAIEGAIQGVRWHNLNPRRRAELKKWFKTLH